MKKFYLLLIAIAAIFSSCDINTTKVIKPGVDIITIYKDVAPEKWIQSGVAGMPGCYVYQEFKMPEIDNKVIREGAVMAYLVDNDNRDNPLPYVCPFDNGRNEIMQNIRFEAEKGYFAIVVEWQDFGAYAADLNPMKIKVCILSPGDDD